MEWATSKEVKVFIHTQDDLNSPKRDDSDKKTYNTRELAVLLGVSRHTIYRMRDGGELPPIIPTDRRIVRWQIKDVELWFDLDCPSTKNFLRLKKDYERFTRRQVNRPAKTQRRVK
jgi:excisionase family DNA binding protein